MSLLEMSVAGAVLILAVTALRALTVNRLPKQTFLVLWGVALLRLLVPYSLPSALSVYSFFARPLPAAGAIQTRPAVQAVYRAVSGTASPVVPVAGAAAGREVDIWALVWMGGALLCGMFFAISWFRCRRGFRTLLPVSEPYVTRWLEGQRSRRRIAVRQSDRIAAPLTYGVFRPVILLPKSVDWTDGEALGYVLAHETVHIRRFDALAKLALTVALCVHWFDPAVWLMYILANRDLELSCDESVLRRSGAGSRRAYALVLIRMEEQKSGLRPLCSHFCKNAIEERIVAIMKLKKTSLVGLLAAVTLVVGVTTAFATSAVEPKADEPPVAEAEMLETVIAEKIITSYVDRYDGKTYYSDDNGQTWESGEDFDVRFGETDIEWWTAEEYETWLEEQRKEYQSMLGERTWSPSKGWVTWDQATIDEALSGNEQLLQEIKDGKMVSKPMWDGDTVITYGYDPRAAETVAECSAVATEGTAQGEAMPDPEREKELLASYASHGISFDDAGRMYYQGELVRWFVDGAEVEDGCLSVQYLYRNDEGTAYLRTVRARKENGDGSYDPFGELTAIVSIEDGQLDEYGFLFEGALCQEASTAEGSVVEDGTVGEDLMEYFSKLEPFGVTFEKGGDFGNVYYHGELVDVLIDSAPDGRYQTVSSCDEGGIQLQTVYDGAGKLSGVVQLTADRKRS